MASVIDIARGVRFKITTRQVYTRGVGRGNIRGVFNLSPIRASRDKTVTTKRCNCAVLTKCKPWSVCTKYCTAPLGLVYLLSQAPFHVAWAFNQRGNNRRDWSMGKASISVVLQCSYKMSKSSSVLKEKNSGHSDG